jgi:small-conductance mechanosensitive channel
MDLRNFRNIAAAGCLALLVGSAFAQTAAKSGAGEAAPVALEGRPLFSVSTSLGPFSARDRAEAASARLRALAKDLTIPVSAVSIAPSDTSTGIVANDRVLLTVTDADAQAARMARDELAAAYAKIIRSAVDQSRGAYSYRSVGMGALYTVIATALLILLLWALARLASALCRRIEAGRGRLIRSIRLQSVELISADRLTDIGVKCVKAVRVAAVVALLYVYLPLVMSFFPWTREYAPTLFGYLVSPLKAAAAALISYVPNLIFVIVAVVAAYGCVRISRFFFDQLAKGTIAWSGFYAEWAQPSHKIVRFLILAFTAVVIFPYLPGSESPAFRGISIFIGVLFSLGSTSAVANVVAGTILTYTRAFRIGDRVRIADTIGDVVEKTLLATRVQTIKNEVVTVPNAMVLGSHITNFSSQAASGRGLILHTSVTIGYDAPWRTVHQLLVAAALRTQGILRDPPPFVYQTALDDFFVHYEVNGYTNEPARMVAIYAELHENIQDSFNEAGVEIMSPHYSSLRDGNRKAIPDQYIPDSYAAPSFRVADDRKTSVAAGG